MRTKREKKNILICKNTLENSLSRKMYKSTYSQKFDHNVVAHHDRYMHSTITSKLRRMIHEFLIFLFSKFLTFIIDKIHLQPKNTLFFWPQHAEAWCRISVHRPGTEPWPQWESTSPHTSPPGNSQYWFLLALNKATNSFKHYFLQTNNATFSSKIYAII